MHAEQSGRVAQWITRLSTEQEKTLSDPAVVDTFVQLHFIALPASSENFRHPFKSEQLEKPCYVVVLIGPRGAMDNASAYLAEDFRFEFCRGRHFCPVPFPLIACFVWEFSASIQERAAREPILCSSINRAAWRNG
ncbi:unnamed protein product [Angiostrongylus costaricensis]|uniref:Dynein_heavy domain-containing protein n=1 Tax=Angiostrongylus costaricensis TaxID=334426 RepID=A0A0R3Q288_ANGCS|nr:unnamed protein product [Angiostrongylus costaricensis]